jgi:hypothetical protein
MPKFALVALGLVYVLAGALATVMVKQDQPE